MAQLATSLFVLVGIVNVLPLLGVLSPARLEGLYGVAIGDPNLLILMRHRAVLFGIVGGLLIAAAFMPELRSAALVAGLASMLSFIALTLSVGDYNPLIWRVTLIDAVASLALALAGAIHWFQR